MKKYNSILLILLTLFFSCDDVLEEDITNDLIQTISPSNGSVVLGNTTHFSWVSLDGVDDYRIQILNESQVNIVDSLISSNTFTYNLSPGNYQWRVKGENFAYQTDYTFPINFSIESSEDLSSQSLVLQTPTDNFYTNNTSIIVTWDEIITAESYSLELIKNLGGLETVLQESDILLTSYNLTSSNFDEDAEYIWKVKAVNTSSETSFAERSIFIDTNTPNQPSLVSPIDLESFSTSTITFNWSNGTDTGNVQSTITNTIEIASDSDFNIITNTSSTESNSYIYTFESTGVYYWRVKAHDLASNESDYSIVRTIEIQ